MNGRKLPIRIGDLDTSAWVYKAPAALPTVCLGQAAVTITLVMRDDDAKALEAALAEPPSGASDLSEILPLCSRAAALRLVDALRLRHGESLAMRAPPDLPLDSESPSEEPAPSQQPSSADAVNAVKRIAIL